MVQIDHQKICMTATGYNQVLLMIDHKICRGSPLHDSISGRNLRSLDKCVDSETRLPHHIPIRQWQIFVGDLTKELMKRSQVAQANSTTYHPQTNDLVEKQNRFSTMSVNGNEREWDEQAMSVNGNQSKLKALVKRSQENGWTVVMVTDSNAECNGHLEIDDWTFIHGRKTGILLNPEWSTRWRLDGSTCSHSNRISNVTVGDWTIVSAYAPTSLRRDTEERQLFWQDLEGVVSTVPARSFLLLGGDFNAQIGGRIQEEDEEECATGRFGLEADTHTGSQMREWLQFNGLCYWNSFFGQKKRGTWLRRMSGKWYELDGFVGRLSQRAKVKRVRTKGVQLCTPGTDHLPKEAAIVTENTKKVYKKPTRKVNIEKLHGRWNDEEVKQRRFEFEEAMQHQMRVEQPKTWEAVAQVAQKVAEEKLGVRARQVDEPWLVMHEDELKSMAAKRHELLERMRAETGAEAVRLFGLMGEIKKKIRKKKRQWETEYWDTVIEESVQA